MYVLTAANWLAHVTLQMPNLIEFLEVSDGGQLSGCCFEGRLGGDGRESHHGRSGSQMFLGFC